VQLFKPGKNIMSNSFTFYLSNMYSTDKEINEIALFIQAMKTGFGLSENDFDKVFSSKLHVDLTSQTLRWKENGLFQTEETTFMENRGYSYVEIEQHTLKIKNVKVAVTKEKDADSCTKVDLDALQKCIQAYQEEKNRKTQAAASKASPKLTQSAQATSSSSSAGSSHTPNNAIPISPTLSAGFYIKAIGLSLLIAGLAAVIVGTMALVGIPGVVTAASGGISVIAGGVLTTMGFWNNHAGGRSAGGTPSHVISPSSVK
jgi:hypothetical protein